MQRKKIIIFFLMFLFLSLRFSFPGTVLSASKLYFIDAHSQVDIELEDLEQIIKRMDKTGVYRTILAARWDLKSRVIVEFAKTHPERIIPAIRTKGRIYTRNRQEYYDRLEKHNTSGQYKAIAETLMFHARKGDMAGELIVYPSDKRVRAALNVALENRWPFIVHIEFAAMEFGEKPVFMEELEKILRAHPEHPFALIHMGQLEPDETEELITKHKNIHFLTSHADPVTAGFSNQPWTNMFEDDRLTPEWKELLTRYPDRFIFALDNVWAEHWDENYLEKMEYWQKALSELPEKVAHAIAHGNAERLWRLTPKSTNN